MKQKYFYSILLLLLSFFGFSQTLDQSNAPVSVGGGGFTVSSTGNVGQSFTAGLTGNLSQVNVRIGGFGASTGGDFQVRIFEGEGYGGTLLNTTVFNVSSFPVSDYSEIVVLLSSMPSVVTGNRYTIDLRGITGSSATQGTGGSGSTYSLGQFFANQSPNNFYSLWFKTFVNVPSPATHLNFDGTNDFVNLGTSVSTALNGTTALTLEAWINPSALNGWNNIITDYDGAYHKFLFRVRNNNNIQFWVNNTALNSSFTVPLNAWTHVAAVYDGANMYVYANGNLIASQAAPASIPSGSQQTNIGSRVGSNTENFTGNIDDLRVWNIARTAEQISASMNCELQGTESGLLAYYQFNQGVDQANNAGITTLNDATANSFNGTLTNFTLNGTSSNWLSGSPVTTGSLVPGNATVTSPVTYNQDAPASALTATSGANGTGLMWYTSATGGTGSDTAPTPSTATAGSTSYWVASTNANGCESERVEIVVNVNAPIPATHLNFDGVDDLVNCGNALNTALDPLNTITVQAWVRPTTNTGLGVIVGNYANPNQSAMQFLLRRDNSGYSFWIQGTATFRTVEATNTVILNTWQHVVGVWNGSELRIYVDGSLIATTTGVTDSSLATTTNSVIIGNNQAGSGAERFTGSIDEVRIWNVALSATDILATKDCELDNTQTNVLAYYKFNHGFDNTNNSSVTTVTDDSGNGNNGTLTNFALTGAASNWASGSAVTTGDTCPLVLSSDNFTQNSLMVYPNPTKGFVNIQTLETVSVEVYDMIGKLILSKKIENEFQNLDLTNFPTGIYLLKATNTNGFTQTHKIIKE